jgi:GNAT superfamily N-acetyltransferase
VNLEIVRLLDASRTDDWHAVGVEVVASDRPDLLEDPVEEVRAQVPDGSPDWRLELYLAYADGIPVARSSLGMPTRDNPKFAGVVLEVVPAFRRRGFGRAMFDFLSERLGELGRSIVAGEVAGPLNGPPPVGAAFAASLGAKRALRTIRSALEVATLRPAELARLERDAKERASGYELVTWIDHAPGDVVDGVAALLGRMVTDSPMGELQFEKEHWDRARVREFEQSTVGWGRVRMGSGARVADDGQLVALTEIGVSRFQPAIGYQWDTIVAPEHRGHRLGQWVKCANLRQLITKMPESERVVTRNAESNRHMIEVNERMGFRAIGREDEWQLELSGVQ